MEASPKSKLIALCLCGFGLFGAHQFYAGNTGKGVIYRGVRL